MTLDARLSRVKTALSPAERALLVLKAFKARRRQDRSLALGMGDWEVKEYHRLLRYIEVCNTEVYTMITMMQGRADVLFTRLSLLLALNMWKEDADLLASCIEAMTREQPTLPPYDRGHIQGKVAREEENARESLTLLWSEVHSLDAALKSIAEREFKGEDLLMEAIRKELDAVIDRLQFVRETLGALDVEVEIAGVTQEQVQEDVDYIEHFVRLGGRR